MDRPDAPVVFVADRVSVQRVDELALPAETGGWLLPGATPELVARTPGLPAGSTLPGDLLALSVHLFAVTAGGVRVLVDTGVGNGKTRTNPAWDHLDTDVLAALTAIGFGPHDVDLVVHTHLHTDHVGWNTRWDGDGWVPTFPGVRHLVSATERGYWSGVELPPDRVQLMADSVEPLVATGQLRTVDVPADGVEVAPGVRLLPTPGHTPGHVAVVLGTGRDQAVITGDCLHHPVQWAHPDLTCSADVDPAQAVRTRRSLTGRLAATGATVLGTHFPPPATGVLRAAGEGHVMVPG